MKGTIIKIKRIKENGRLASIPFYATPGAAGADLYAFTKEEIVLPPGGSYNVPTGISIELPNKEMVALVFGRSGMAAKFGVSLANGVGVIDSDYRGEIKVLLINHGKEPVVIQHGDRIAQIVIMPIINASFAESDELSSTERGAGGFGSTGI